MLDAVARVLLLNDVERGHLCRLAGLNPPQREAPPTVAASPELERLLEAWAPRPGYIRDRHWRFTAVNAAARQVFGYGDTDHNCLVSYFTSARFRALHQHWDEAAPALAAGFRAGAARYPDDPEFDRIAAEVAQVSPEFAALWARHDAAEHVTAVKAVEHPEAGLLVFDTTMFPVVDHPGHHLILHNPRPGTDTEEKLTRLLAG